MIKKIQRFIALSLMAIGLLSPVGAPLLVGSAAFADNISGNICGGVDAAAGTSTTCQKGGAGTDNLKKVAGNIIKVFSWIVGVVSVIMIIYGGFRYITSGGDSNNIGSAKNTIVYAIIGLVIVALAQFIVHFVLNTASSSI